MVKDELYDERGNVFIFVLMICFFNLTQFPHGTPF